MAAMEPDPTNLTVATKLPPNHNRKFSKSRSPSRSPVRKAQFAARELDPLLKNLSPDSTLEALQETDAIGGDRAEHNAIAQSISDASESERELGIRAAIAAKKLREWTEEVTTWHWAPPRDRVWGAGFLPPTTNKQGAPMYFGSLPKETIHRYEERLDEIWDAIEALGMDDIKDYVFSSHLPHQRSTSNPTPSNYGRMRDFTALVTATVIQSLPVLANLHILLETWSVRLTVLRQVPDLLIALEQVRLALGAISEIVQDEEKSSKLNKRELETGKVMFGNKVSSLGKRVDNLLDILEGQEDSLPQTWIDSLEAIENKYAEWVAQAEQVVLRNQMAGDHATSKSHTPTTTPSKVPLPGSAKSSLLKAPLGSTSSGTTANLATSTPNLNVIKRKPLLDTNPRADQGHRRGVSEVSVADSTMSGYSLENAEIVDARAAPVMPSPRISVIDHQFPGSTPASSWMANKNNQPSLSPTRPAMLQRASTASMEFVPKDQIRKVILRKSASHDILGSHKSSSSTLQPTFNQSTATESAITSPQHELEDPIAQDGLPYHLLTPLAISPSPSLRVDPLSLRGKEIAQPSSYFPAEQPPIVPRRSSKRLSMPLLEPPKRPFAQNRTTNTKSPTVSLDRNTVSATPLSRVKQEESFDDKLKVILASMPTKIKLTEGSDSGSSGMSSMTSSRSSSPVRALKLSPVKDGKSGQAHTTSSDIRVYHLKGGKARDAAPVKLFVRAVGEHGERVMVRVGGGWVDLAEYLREYSLHHGGRGLSERKLEVASLPGDHKPQGSTSSAGPVMLPKTRPTLADEGFQFGLNNEGQIRPAEAVELEANPWRPPPVPIVPHWYARAQSTSPTRSSIRSTPTSISRPGSRISTTTHTTPAMMTTITSTNSSYTPLGGAGPVVNSRRVAPNVSPRTPSNDAWVEGVMNQARVVSGSHTSHAHNPHNSASPSNNSISTTTVYSPTIVTTSTISSSRSRGVANTARRVSSWSTMPTQTPSNNTSIRPSAVSISQGSQISSVSNTSSGSNDSYATAGTSRSMEKNELDKKKSRMSMGDMSGIRRVFLKKKSDVRLSQA